MSAERDGSWLSRHKGVIWLALGFIILVICGYILPIPRVTGFTTYQDPPNQGYHATKTVWDWLQLLALPGFVSIVAYFLSSKDNEIERGIAEKRDEKASTIASENRQATLLQDYLDRISSLILEHKLRNPQTHAEALNIARAHTLTVLSQLKPERKGRLIQFLYESQLITANTEDSISLQNADLREADLRDFDLSGTNLSGANLAGAMLNGINLSEAQLRGTVLDEADLSGATLRSTDLCQASLRKAILNHASLHNTNLSQANLSDIWLTQTEFTEVDVSDAITIGARADNLHRLKEIFSNEQLSKMRQS